MSATAAAVFSGAQKVAKRVIKVPPPPKVQPSTVKLVDHTKMPKSLADAEKRGWDSVPASYNIFPPKDKMWMPVLPKDWNTQYFPNVIVEPNAENHKGRISTLVFTGVLLYWYWTMKRDKEMLGFEHTPPESFRWV